MRQEENRTELMGTDHEIEHSISSLTALELPWRLPVQAIATPQKRPAQVITICDMLGQPTKKIEFASIILEGRRRFEIPGDSRMPVLQFASDSRKFPLFHSNGSLTAQVPLKLEQLPWRLRQPVQQFGFPASGCYSFDFLQKGIFASPQGWTLSRRFKLQNWSSQSQRISLVPDQEWLAVEPTEFHLRPGESSDVVVRLLPDRLSPGQNQATLRIRWKTDKLKIAVLATAGRAVAPAVLLSRELSLPVAGLENETQIALKFDLSRKGEIRGAVTDLLHRTRSLFQASGDAGALEIPVTLSSAELFRVIHSEWLLYVSFECGGISCTEKVRIRLQRGLQFDPSMAILAGHKPALVQIKEVTGKQVHPHTGDIPAGLEVHVTGQALSIRRKRTAAKNQQMEWIAVEDKLSGERADLPVLFQGERT